MRASWVNLSLALDADPQSLIKVTLLKLSIMASLCYNFPVLAAACQLSTAGKRAWPNLSFACLSLNALNFEREPTFIHNFALSTYSYQRDTAVE